jgi:meiosis-specific transcription factor NDT80
VERQKHGRVHSTPGSRTVSSNPSSQMLSGSYLRAFITSSPPPSLSPPLSYGVTHTMPGSSFGTGRNLNDSYAPAYSMNRPGLTSVYANTHELLRYGNQYPQAQRATESYAFSSTNGTYHHQPTVTLESSARPVTTRPDGPPFDDTQVIHPVITSLNHQLVPEITASIQKGFFQVDGKWTCYRRNYFTVSCSFSFRTSSYEGQLYLQRHSSHQAELIKQFAISISAKTAVMNSNQESEARTLVQHTPKRDKATESIPGKVTIQPAPTPSLPSSGALPANGNLYMNPQQAAPSGLPDYHSAPGYSPTQHQMPPTSHTFERIQFQKATANNGKRRAQQQYFHIVVELSADVSRTGESPHWVRIATKQSEPMVVRGRSPGHYKDNGRRDSSASMDPDRGSGASGDLGAGLNSVNGLLGSSPSHPSSMDWESSHHNRNSMGGYRRAQEPNISPPSDISTDSAPSSPTDLGISYQAMQSKALGHCTSLASRVLQNGVMLSSIDCEKRDVPRLNLRNCGVDMMLPKPPYSSPPLDFGIYGTQHIDMHMVPHFQAICS